jgi:hypothetical protein
VIADPKTTKTPKTPKTTKTPKTPETPAPPCPRPAPAAAGRVYSRAWRWTEDEVASSGITLADVIAASVPDGATITG